MRNKYIKNKKQMKEWANVKMWWRRRVNSTSSVQHLNIIPIFQFLCINQLGFSNCLKDVENGVKIKR